MRPIRSTSGSCTTVAVLLALCSSCALLGAGLPTLISARAAHELSIEESSRAYPVHFTCTITYIDPYIVPGHVSLFVGDLTGGVFVSLASAPKVIPKNGDLVEITGVSGPGDFAPVVAQAKLRLIGQSHLPEIATRASLTHLLTGAEDSQWVEVEGVVRSAKLAGKHARLTLAMSDGSIVATTVQEPGADYGALVDATVRLRGTVAHLFNHQHQMTGVTLLFPSLKTVTVKDVAEAQPFSSRLDSVTHLLRYSPKVAYRHRAHLRGVLTLLWPGRMACFQDGGQGLCAETAQSTALVPGDEVDVIGFPALGDFSPVMTDSIYQATGLRQKETSLLTTAEKALDEAQDSRLVQIEGKFIGWDRAARDPALLLSSGKYIFPAILPGTDRATAQTREVEPWQEGSILRITGISSIQADKDQSKGVYFGIPSSFRIIMRSPRDVMVVKPPSWWSARHALFVLAGALAIIVCTALALFRQVGRVRKTASKLRREMAERQRAEEATRYALNRMEHQAHHDPLTGLANRLIFNKSLLDALAQADQTETCVGLLFLDLDRFKAVNDSLGHAAGDLVLQRAAERLTSLAPENSVLARLGGDEFALVMPNIASHTQAETVAERVVELLSEPYIIEGSSCHCPASVGVSMFPDDAQCATMLQRNADTALYCAKRTAPGQVVCFSGLERGVGTENLTMAY